MCDFCKIIEKKIDAFIIHETDKNIVFLDYAPINEGHVLIVPKFHAASIVDISSDTLAEINEIIKKIVIIYEKEYGAEGYSIMQNGGKFCDYGHYHMHVFPRFKDDGFAWKDSGIRYDYSVKVAEKIRKAFI